MRRFQLLTLLLTLVQLPAHFAAASRVDADLERVDGDFAGWAGATHDPAANFAHVLAADESRSPWVETISAAQPRAYVFHSFLSEAEADHLVALASSRFRTSKTVAADGSISINSYRTSSGAGLRRAEDAVVAAIEARIAAWLNVPVETAEPLQVLSYDVGETFKPHHDYFFEEKSIRNGGQRVATVLMYLNDMPEGGGGETVFPNSVQRPMPEEALQLSECARQGLAVQARKGDALLFYSVMPDGNNMDEHSLHAGCPVLKGQKAEFVPRSR